MIQANTASSANPRGEIEAHLVAGDQGAALLAARRYWVDSPNASTARYIAGLLDRLWPAERIVTHRLAFLRSFTLEPVVPLLAAEAALTGCRLLPWIGDFNTYGQEILDPTSPLYQHDPQTVILAVQTRDLTPPLWAQFADLSDADIAHEIEAAFETLCGLVRALRERTSGTILVHGLERPAMTAYGLLDTSRATGQVDAIDEINRKLRRAFREMTDVHWLDYDEVQARHGRQRWLDAKKWATARLPFSVSALPVMAAEWWRHLTPVVLPAAKVMVLDLDNTLWGGTVGEDGLSGLKLGNEYPGIFFRDLQQAVLDIAARGVMIAVASKNNEADALQVFDEHPDMLITRDQIAAKRINWSPKPDNLVEIAQELNLGLDAFVFIDDNPVEREAVRRALPEVHVIDLPADPAGYANALRSAAVLERYTLSAEDRKRDIYYRDEKLRRDAIAQADDMESFLRSLAIEVDVAPVDPLSVPRAAQLTQKTNQLNTTTMRCTESDIQAMTQDSARRVLTLHARDRFGDNGIVGVAICRLGDKHCEIENLLLSCRVIGRHIETAFLAAVQEMARAAGATSLGGWFRPTKKNRPASGIFSAAGFDCDQTDEEAQHWRRHMSAGPIPVPEWIVLRQTSAEASA